MEEVVQHVQSHCVFIDRFVVFGCGEEASTDESVVVDDPIWVYPTKALN